MVTPEALNDRISHICICICTYKRRQLLKQLLEKLGEQQTCGLFTFSIVVVDNDSSQSAEATVSEFAASSAISIKYCIEPQQNIALARNKAIDNSYGEFIAFIDDDEFPTEHWLVTLFNALKSYEVDGVLGPVKPHFDKEPPEWVVQGKFYDRPSYSTGLGIEGKMGRTGNVLMKKQILTSLAQLFRPEFRSGEDQDFFRRLIEKGYVFIWCHEAPAYEVVPPIRWTRSFILRRSLLRGACSVHHTTFGVRDVANSVVALPVYTLALPFALLLGQGRFMILLVKLFDHLGRLLALLGINPIKEAYITD